MSRKTIFLSFFFLILYLGNSVFAEENRISSVPLYRLDETLWSFHQDGLEIRVLTPGFNCRAVDYQLACRIADSFKKDKELVDLSNEKNILPELQQTWEMIDITKKWYDDLDVFFGEGFDPESVRVIQIKPSSWFQRGLFSIKSWFGNDTGSLLSFYLPWDEKGWESHVLEDGLFNDPFTCLASQALQKDETPFVTDKACRGSYRFIIRDQKLMLEPIKKTEDEDLRDSIAAIEAYRAYLKRTFAWCILDGVENIFEQELDTYASIFENNKNQEEQLFGYLKYSMGIDFDDLIKNHQPLLPDHVFKCNISVNNVEMPQVESLFLRITKQLKLTIFSDKVVLETPLQFFNFLKELKVSSYFSLKEIRGLYCSFKKFSGPFPLTSKSFRAFLDSFTFIEGQQQSGYGEKIRDLTPDAFHRLMEILFVDTGLLEAPSDGDSFSERFFTGRKIIHLGITGYKTMGDRDEYDPCRNLFELLHLYRPLIKANETILQEVLPIVVAKKSLWSHYPAKSIPVHRERRVARLLPFPDYQGEKRWYYVDGLLNDGKGDLNYVLVPACKGYLEVPGGHHAVSKRSPLIKLYRSTASDSEAESSIDSLLADTNPEKVGSLDFRAGDEYEVTYFRRCTMSLWTGYLIIGEIKEAVKAFKEIPFFKDKKSKVLSSQEDKKHLLLQFIVWQRFQIQGGDLKKLELLSQEDLNLFIQEVGTVEFECYLTESIQGMEWEKQKIAQDIVFIGHSLGGALSQSGLYHFGPEQNRIPLFGCHYECIAYDTPGVTKDEAEQFLKFGRTHKALLLALKQLWKIKYQFEYEDLVPQGGSCFLGIPGYDPKIDESWLNITASVCRPFSSAQDIILTTQPTHGRRFNHAQPSIDYQRTALTIPELNRLKENWTLSGSLRKKFGYEWTVPKMTETLRRTVPGTFAFTYFWIKKQATSFFSPENLETDKDGVIFCTYKGRGAVRGYIHETTLPPDLVGLLEANSSFVGSTP